MKKLLFLVFVAAFAVSCTDEGTNNTVNLDSLGTKIETGTEKVLDSAKEKANDLKNIDIDINKKDSADRADSIKN